MVEQQIMKPYKLLSSGIENIFVKDPMFKRHVVHCECDLNMSPSI